MRLLDLVGDGGVSIGISAATVAAVVLALAIIGRILERRRLQTGGPRVVYQFVKVVLYFLGLLIIILVLPINDTTRGQLYTLLGLVVSASIALSSSTLVGNALAGLQIRFVAGSRLRLGDYIRLDDQVGRVTQMGILATDPDRDS